VWDVPAVTKDNDFEQDFFARCGRRRHFYSGVGKRSAKETKGERNRSAFRFQIIAKVKISPTTNKSMPATTSKILDVFPATPAAPDAKRGYVLTEWNDDGAIAAVTVIADDMSVIFVHGAI
jgi:hypothetical protein